MIAEIKKHPFSQAVINLPHFAAYEHKPQGLLPPCFLPNPSHPQANLKLSQCRGQELRVGASWLLRGDSPASPAAGSVTPVLLGSLPVTMALLRLSLLHHKVSQSQNERPQPLPLFDLISWDDEITILALNERQVQIRRWAIIQQPESWG